MSEIVRKTLSTTLKLVSFDVTGTLLTLRHSPGTVYERVAREECGYSNLKRPALDQGFRRHFKALSQEFPNYGRVQGMHWQDWWTLLVKKTLQDSGVTDSGHLQRISEKLIDIYGTKECWTAVPHSIDVVRRIKSLGLHTGIITNSDPRTGDILQSVGFPEFDFVISAYDAEVTKPDQRIFEMALKHCPSPVTCREAMHVGNDPSLDYRAANKSGWTGVLIDSELEYDDPQTFTFKSLDSFQRHCFLENLKSPSTTKSR